jgi:cytochrome c biogenesis protein CcmG, thiol:disulfide interchange protein DsbE
MTDGAPPDPTGSNAPDGSPQSASSEAAPPLRKPRTIFLLVGVVLAVALGIGLFTGIGTSQSTSGAPRVGGPVPSFTATNVGRSGSSQVSVPDDGGGNGVPAVLLFFGAWCPSCSQELPPLAAAASQQERSSGPLSHIHVLGIDSEDSASTARQFIHKEGVTFPVALDPNVSITNGLFYFDGDPYAVFVRGNGTIGKIVAGAVLTPSSFKADERALIPSGT